MACLARTPESDLYRFEIKGLKGEALEPVWTTAQPNQKQPINRKLALQINL
jgi:hypothetical protein